MTPQRDRFVNSLLESAAIAAVLLMLFGFFLKVLFV